MEMTIEQQRAIALATARARLAEQQAPTTDAMPSTMDGFTVATAGVGLPEEVRRIGRGLDTMARTGANALTFGLADKFAGGMDALTGAAPSYDAGVKSQRAQTQKAREDDPGAAVVGELAGGVAGGAGLIKSGVTLAGRVGPKLLPRVLGYGLEGGAYGAAHGAGNTYSDKPQDYVDNAKKGASFGAAVGAGLPVAGTVASGAYRTGSAFLGPRVADTSRGASAMLRAAAQADETGIHNLPQMGGAAMLPDAGPAMLGLAQGAGTGTGQGRSRLVNALTTREQQTGPRLARSLDDNLGPAPVPSQIEDGLEASRQAVRLQYAPAIASGRAVNTQQLANALDVAATNLRGPAQRAVRQVREMLDVAGAPGNLDPHPGVLHNTRQAIDGLLATETNPQTIGALTMARRAVDAELGRAVPGIKAVDAQFSELSRQSGGLARGSQILDTGKTAIRPDELAQEISMAARPQGQMVGPSAVPVRMRQGLRAEVDRVVGTQVNDLGALERTLATPRDWNQQKMAQMFGDAPTAAVAKALMDNRTFRNTYQKVVENSQTAQRVGAAKAMDGAAGGNIPQDLTMTSLGLRALNAVAKAISGASGAQTKDEIGRVLSAQGPRVNQIAQELLRSAQTASQNSSTLARVLSAPQLIGASSPAAGRK